jgi:hypothetical protein
VSWRRGKGRAEEGKEAGREGEGVPKESARKYPRIASTAKVVDEEKPVDASVPLHRDASFLYRHKRGREGGKEGGREGGRGVRRNSYEKTRRQIYRVTLHALPPRPPFSRLILPACRTVRSCRPSTSAMAWLAAAQACHALYEVGESTVAR